ncbi:ParB N-terminal domain-containing protein [Herpetosiphon geysericola]|uniref:ParB N-terminal domain-containing protein n=1 Tax=Herpetosiphon geysericola TaxID=70996 RepID=UPI0006C8FE87|nr:ParB N-terminal domain-containing protein [Herpetosiphon geysericola]
MTFVKPEVEEIDTRFVRTDGGTQTRASLSMFTVDNYAEAMKDGVVFPPIITYYDGSEYWLADGFHRLAAAERAGHSAIDCEIRQGTRRDAILYSVGANSNHGLQRTREDVRRAIDLLLRDDEWREWSDSVIAAKVGCNNKTVGSRRAELVAVGEIEDSGIRRAADGRLMNTAKIGDGPTELPSASMLTPEPTIHASMPTDQELAVVEPEPTLTPAPKAIPSIVNFQAAPRVENHPIPATPALAPVQAAAPKPMPAPQLVPSLTPAAAPPLLTLTPASGPTLTPLAAPAPSHDLQSVIQTQAIAALIQSMAAEAQRIAHETLTTYEQTSKHYIEIEVDKGRFENAGKLMLTSPSIQSQAAFLAVAITIEDA